MQEKTDTEEDSAAPVVPVPWRVVALDVLPGYRLNVRFRDGSEGIVDVSRMILGPNPGVFEVLRDPAEFAKAHVEAGVVTWPGELDLAPDAMYDEIKANGHWVIDE